MKRYFARVTALLCGWLMITALVAVAAFPNVPYVTALWQTAPLTITFGLIILGLVWGIDNWFDE
jgi:membrane protease YdiL (CAAX protease family)